MNLCTVMQIQPGYYKIKIKGWSRDFPNHYLRVFIKDKIKYLQIDHGIPTEAEKCEEEVTMQYEIVKRLTPGTPIQVNQLMISISWVDEDKDLFEFQVRNIHAFERVLRLFPRVARALGVKVE